MMFVILVAAVGLAVSGLLVVAYGITVQLSTGNTLILAGVIAFCTGVIMLGFWTLVRELRAIARKLGNGVTEMRSEAAALPGESAQDFEPAADFRGPEPSSAPPLFPSTEPPPWQNETVLRDHPIPDPLHPEPEAPPKQKRNLLFSSSRRDRARAGEPLSPEMLASELRSRPSAKPAAEPAEPPPSFDEGWSRPGRAKAGDTRRDSRMPPPVSGSGNAGDQARATVLKSGIVDGMAYSLYSDGSIEAQMPEGMMTFSSIDELRAHLDQRS